MSHIVNSFKSTTKALGWINGPLYLLTRGLDRISGGRVRIVKYDLAAQPLGEKFPLPYRHSTSMELRELREGDPLLAYIERPVKTLEERFRQGGRCLAAVRGDEVLGFLWWVEGPYEEDEVRCCFVPSPGRSVGMGFRCPCCAVLSRQHGVRAALGRSQSRSVHARFQPDLQPHIGVQAGIASRAQPARCARGGQGAVLLCGARGTDVFHPIPLGLSFAGQCFAADAQSGLLSRRHTPGARISPHAANWIRRAYTSTSTGSGWLRKRAGLAV